MIQDSTHRFSITRGCLTFYGCTLALIAHEEIEFHATIFMKIIQLTSHLPKDVCHEVLLDGTIITKQVTLQNA